MWITGEYPEEGDGVIVATEVYGIIETHLRAAAWSGSEWIDVDGQVVKGVVAWTPIPKYMGGTKNEGLQTED